FLWDDTAWNHMETPYYLNYSNTPLPEPFDLRNTKFADSFGYRVLEPLQKYRWTYKDRDIISFDLEFDAFMKPWVTPKGDPPKARHLDQFGHITGELMLHGEVMKVDCLAMRDRSWSHIRPEPWKDGAGGGTYITGAASKDLAFFGAGPGGFFLQDGVR